MVKICVVGKMWYWLAAFAINFNNFYIPLTSAKTMYKLPEDTAPAPKYVGAFVI